jgi:Na+/H+-dicarboxylate symporter
MVESDFSTLRALGILRIDCCIRVIYYGFYFYPTLLLILQSKSHKIFQSDRTCPIVSFSTSSSAATLPVTMECVTEHVGVDEVSSFVLPLELLLYDGYKSISGGGSHFIAQAIPNP